LHETGEPEILTVNGLPRLVIQDADAYERLLQKLDEAEAIGILHVRLASVDRGEPGVPAKEALDSIRREIERPR